LTKSVGTEYVFDLSSHLEALLAAGRD
jgi:hypothetical protein